MTPFDDMEMEQDPQDAGVATRPSVPPPNPSSRLDRHAQARMAARQVYQQRISAPAPAPAPLINSSQPALQKWNAYHGSPDSGDKLLRDAATRREAREEYVQTFHAQPANIQQRDLELFARNLDAMNTMWQEHQILSHVSQGDAIRSGIWQGLANPLGAFQGIADWADGDFDQPLTEVGGDAVEVPMDMEKVGGSLSRGKAIGLADSAIKKLDAMKMSDLVTPEQRKAVATFKNVHGWAGLGRGLVEFGAVAKGFGMAGKGLEKFAAGRGLAGLEATRTGAIEAAITKAAAAAKAEGKPFTQAMSDKIGKEAAAAITTGSEGLWGGAARLASKPLKFYGGEIGGPGTKIIGQTMGYEGVIGGTRNVMNMKQNLLANKDLLAADGESDEQLLDRVGNEGFGARAGAFAKGFWDAQPEGASMGIGFALANKAIGGLGRVWAPSKVENAFKGVESALNAERGGLWHNVRSITAGSTQFNKFVHNFGEFYLGSNFGELIAQVATGHQPEAFKTDDQMTKVYGGLAVATVFGLLGAKGSKVAERSKVAEAKSLGLHGLEAQADARIKGIVERIPQKHLRDAIEGLVDQGFDRKKLADLLDNSIQVGELGKQGTKNLAAAVKEWVGEGKPQAVTRLQGARRQEMLDLQEKGEDRTRKERKRSFELSQEERRGSAAEREYLAEKAANAPGAQPAAPGVPTEAKVSPYLDVRAWDRTQKARGETPRVATPDEMTRFRAELAEVQRRREVMRQAGNTKGVELGDRVAKLLSQDKPLTGPEQVELQAKLAEFQKTVTGHAQVGDVETAIRQKDLAKARTELERHTNAVSNILAAGGTPSKEMRTRLTTLKQSVADLEGAQAVAAGEAEAKAKGQAKPAKKATREIEEVDEEIEGEEEAEAKPGEKPKTDLADEDLTEEGEEADNFNAVSEAFDEDAAWDEGISKRFKKARAKHGFSADDLVAEIDKELLAAGVAEDATPTNEHISNALDNIISGKRGGKPAEVKPFKGKAGKGKPAKMETVKDEEVTEVGKKKEKKEKPKAEEFPEETEEGEEAKPEPEPEEKPAEKAAKPPKGKKEKKAPPPVPKEPNTPEEAAALIPGQDVGKFMEMDVEERRAALLARHHELDTQRLAALKAGATDRARLQDAKDARAEMRRIETVIKRGVHAESKEARKPRGKKKGLETVGEEEVTEVGKKAEKPEEEEGEEGEEVEEPEPTSPEPTKPKGPATVSEDEVSEMGAETGVPEWLAENIEGLNKEADTIGATAEIVDLAKQKRTAAQIVTALKGKHPTISKDMVRAVRSKHGLDAADVSPEESAAAAVTTAEAEVRSRQITHPDVEPDVGEPLTYREKLEAYRLINKKEKSGKALSDEEKNFRDEIETAVTRMSNKYGGYPEGLSPQDKATHDAVLAKLAKELRQQQDATADAIEKRRLKEEQAAREEGGEPMSKERQAKWDEMAALQVDIRKKMAAGVDVSALRERRRKLFAELGKYVPKKGGKVEEFPAKPQPTTGWEGKFGKKGYTSKAEGAPILVAFKREDGKWGVMKYDTLADFPAKGKDTGAVAKTEIGATAQASSMSDYRGNIGGVGVDIEGEMKRREPSGEVKAVDLPPPESRKGEPLPSAMQREPETTAEQKMAEKEQTRLVKNARVQSKRGDIAQAFDTVDKMAPGRQQSAMYTYVRAAQAARQALEGIEPAGKGKEFEFLA